MHGNLSVIYQCFKRMKHALESRVHPTTHASFLSPLLMRSNKPIAPVFPHHNPLIDKLAAQAGNVIMKRLENGVDLFFVIKTTPFK